MDNGIHLTDQEFEIIYNMMNGMNTTEIAAHLGVSQSTVSCHNAKIIAKCRAKTMLEAFKILVNGRYYGLLKC